MQEKTITFSENDEL